MTRLARAFHTKKRLGQNFLVDPESLRAVADNLDAKPGDKVVEIGPGLGFLTRFLSASGADVLAVELDSECVTDLDKLQFPHVTVTNQDFLRFDIGSVGERIKLVGNVPYQITTPIIAHIFGEIGEPSTWFPKIERVVLTVQYEVAQRFVAAAGTEHYSQVSLLVQYFSTPRLIRRVPREFFFPEPQVNSAIVEFVPLDKPPVQVKDIKMLRKVIKAGFSQRRKMIKNNFGFLHAEPDALDAAFAKAHVNPQTRAETLSLQQFARLADAMLEVDRSHD